jgi:hypothetical protein
MEDKVFLCSYYIVSFFKRESGNKVDILISKLHIDIYTVHCAKSLV